MLERLAAWAAFTTLNLSYRKINDAAKLFKNDKKCMCTLLERSSVDRSSNKAQGAVSPIANLIPEGRGGGGEATVFILQGLPKFSLPPPSYFDPYFPNLPLFSVSLTSFLTSIYRPQKIKKNKSHLNIGMLHIK